MNESNILAFLEDEFRIAGLHSGTDPEEQRLADNVRELVKVFIGQHHSGSTAAMALYLFDRLIHFRPITPLSGRDDEWVYTPIEMGDGTEKPLWQNRRAPSVFKDEEKAYDVDMAPVFVLSDGTAFTRGGDAMPILAWPYVPGTRETVHIEKEADAASYPWAMKSNG